MNTHLIRISLYILLACLIMHCSRHKHPRPNVHCSQNITAATDAFKQKSAELSKPEQKRIRHLIKAATIQQQHNDFSGCIEKTSRALTLLKEDELSKSQAKANKEKAK